MSSIKNFSDLEKVVPDLGYSEATKKNVLAAVRKSAKIYNTDLSRIPSDLGAFETRWGRGRIRQVPEIFKNAAQFRTWRKYVVMSLKRIQNAKPASPIDDGWKNILDAVSKHQGKGKLLGSNSHITVGVVARAASDRNCSITSMNEDWINATNAELTNAQRKSFKRGIDRLNTLIANRHQIPELRAQLPEESLPLPRQLRPRKSNWTRKSKNPDASLIWLDFERIMHDKKYGGDEEPIENAPAEFSEQSEIAYENTLNWFLGRLAMLERLEPGMDLADVITAQNLASAVNDWIEERRSRNQETTTSTLHNHVTRLVHLAIQYLDPSPREIQALRKIRQNKAVRTKSVGSMSQTREKWIQEFARNPAKQEKAHRLPETLRAKSSAILDRMDRGQTVSKSEQMLALRMGITSVAIAILFRASPVRSSNLRRLRFRGDNAEFTMGKRTKDARLQELRICIPGAQVKNGWTIDEIADDDLEPIVTWYLEKIRPRLIEHHPYGVKMVDSDFLFPSTSDAAMDRTVFGETVQRALSEVNFHMTLHQARHVTAYWILSVDPNAWVEVSALLGDTEATVRNYYAWLDKRRASEAARRKVRQQRASYRQHKAGAYAYA